MSISNIQERAHISSTCATQKACATQKHDQGAHRGAHPRPLQSAHQGVHALQTSTSHAQECMRPQTQQRSATRGARQGVCLWVPRSVHQRVSTLQMSTSHIQERAFSTSAHLSGASNPKAHFGVHAKEHVLGHQDAHNRGAHIEKCTPRKRNAHMLRSQCTRPGTTMRSPWANRTCTPRAHRTHAPRCCVQHVHPGCNTCTQGVTCASSFSSTLKSRFVYGIGCNNPGDLFP